MEVDFTNRIKELEKLIQEISDEIKDIKSHNNKRGRCLIGQTVHEGTKFKVIGVKSHLRQDRVCVDEYLGKIGTFNSTFTFTENGYHSTARFEEEYVNAIDRRNGCFCWRWDEVELL